MGQFCSRRAHSIILIQEQQPIIEVNIDDDDWDVIPLGRRNIRFIRAVKRIRNLLALRLLHSRFGSWLNTTASRAANKQRIRRTIAQLYSVLPRTALRGTAIIFNHLQRRGGKLFYKDARASFAAEARFRQAAIRR